MKELVLLLGCLFFYQLLTAQTWSEWFQQNQTQLQYLQEQIAALQVLNATQQSGYAVTTSGLVVIDTTEEGDFFLHEEHFDYLRGPSNDVLHDPRIEKIDTLCEWAMVIADGILNLAPLWPTDDTGFIQTAKQAATGIRRSAQSISDGLTGLLAYSWEQMSDAEREKELAVLADEAKLVFGRATRLFEDLINKPFYYEKENL